MFVGSIEIGVWRICHIETVRRVGTDLRSGSGVEQRTQRRRFATNISEQTLDCRVLEISVWV